MAPKLSVKEREELQEKMEPHVTPKPALKDQPEVYKGPGAKPAVVKNFNDDERSDEFSTYLQQGLTEEEAGILAGFAPEEIVDLQEKSDSYRRFVRLQVIKFKQKHLKVISETKDVKTSTWMLEKNFPNEYAVKPKHAPPEGGGTHIVQAIIKSIQVSPDHPVVYEHDDIINKKETAKHDGAQDHRQLEPSTDAGGANIIP